MSGRLGYVGLNVTTDCLPYRMSREDSLALSDLLSMYNPCGPVRQLRVSAGAACAAPILVSSADTADVDHLVRIVLGRTGLEPRTASAMLPGGKGVGWSSALASALGEAVERLAGVLAWSVLADRVRRCSCDELTARGLRCVDPGWCQPFATEQLEAPRFPFVPFTSDLQLAWVPSTSLVTGEEVWVPAQLAGLLTVLAHDEPLIGVATSGGLACGPTWESAVLGGLLEVIERDALNLSWVCGPPPPRIDLARSVIGADLRRELASCDRRPPGPAFALHRFDLPDVSVVSASRHRPVSRLGFACGTAAALDPSTAALGALRELVQVEVQVESARRCPSWSSSSAVRELDSEDPDPEKMDTIFERQVLWGHELLFDREQPRLVGPETCLLGEPSVSGGLDGLLGLMADANLEPLVIDVTGDGLLFGRDHLRITKALVPDLTPLNVPPYSMLGHRRYRDLPCALGLADRPLTFADFNLLPLPYP